MVIIGQLFGNKVSFHELGQLDGDDTDCCLDDLLPALSML